MGHQTHSTGLRLPLNKRWSSKWSVNIKHKTHYQFLVHQDHQIKEFLSQLFLKYNITIGNVIIKRSSNNIFLFIPINADINSQMFKKSTLNFDLKKSILQETIENYLERFTDSKVHLFLSPINNVVYNAKMLADFMANEIKKRKPYLPVIQNIFKKLTLKQGSSLLKSSIIGIKIHCAGRLNGVDRARTAKMSWGQLPLNKLTAEIDYAKSTAFTKFGTIGIKVWVAFK